MPKPKCCMHRIYSSQINKLPVQNLTAIFVFIIIIRIIIAFLYSKYKIMLYFITIILCLNGFEFYWKQLCLWRDSNHDLLIRSFVLQLSYTDLQLWTPKRSTRINFDKLLFHLVRVNSRLKMYMNCI